MLPSWFRAHPALSVSTVVTMLQVPLPQTGSILLRLRLPAFEHPLPYEQAEYAVYVIVPQLLPWVVRGQPVVSVSTDETIWQTLLWQVGSVRLRVREPEVVQASG